MVIGKWLCQFSRRLTAWSKLSPDLRTFAPIDHAWASCLNAIFLMGTRDHRTPCHALRAIVSRPRPTVICPSIRKITFAPHLALALVLAMVMPLPLTIP